MSHHLFYKKASFILVLLIFLHVMHGQSESGTEVDQIQKKVVRTIEIRQIIQKKEDAWAGKKAELMANYRSLKANKEYLEKFKLQTERSLASQKAHIAELERRIKEWIRIREESQSYLESAVRELEGFIKKDLPFLSKERSNRLSSIKELLARSDKTASEKLRRVMEALQIETEYGRTVEIYQDTIDLNGQSMLVDILRLGRLSLFCQTPDGKVVGHYDRSAERWVSLSPGYRRNINKAVDMARRERTIDLVTLPIGRINVP